MKHVIAINVLRDEIEQTQKDILYLQSCLAKSKIKSALMPNREATILSVSLRWKRQMKEKVKKVKALEEAVAALERDI